MRDEEEEGFFCERRNKEERNDGKSLILLFSAVVRMHLSSLRSAQRR